MRKWIILPGDEAQDPSRAPEQRADERAKVSVLCPPILCLIARENYPFSFPDYSSFAKNSFYIYLADGTGQPLATSRFGPNDDGMKKFSNRTGERNSGRQRSGETGFGAC